VCVCVSNEDNNIQSIFASASDMRLHRGAFVVTGAGRGRRRELILQRGIWDKGGGHEALGGETGGGTLGEGDKWVLSG